LKEKGEEIKKYRPKEVEKPYLWRRRTYPLLPFRVEKGKDVGMSRREVLDGVSSEEEKIGMMNMKEFVVKVGREKVKFQVNLPLQSHINQGWLWIGRRKKRFFSINKGEVKREVMMRKR
jgi:hypothetical protein